MEAARGTIYHESQGTTSAQLRYTTVTSIYMKAVRSTAYEPPREKMGNASCTWKGWREEERETGKKSGIKKKN